MEQKLNEDLKDLNEDIEVNEIDGNENDQQKEGLDYFDTYSPVTRITSIRMLIV